MRIILKLKTLAAILSISLFFIFLLSLPATAGSSVDDFISDYQSIENNLPSGTSLPISSATLISVKSLFHCVDNGGDIGVCIDDFSHTPTGSQMVTESGLPSSVMSVLHAYAEYKDGDVWGVVYYLGEAVACAVVQVLAGGADICGLIKELIEIGKAIWETATAAFEWFKDVGEAVLEGLEDAGCALHVCCCDEPPPPPPEWQVLYSGYFAPRLSEGLNAIKDSSYNKLPNFIDTIKNAVYSKYSPAAIKIASDYFAKQVDGAWTAEVVPGILNQLNNKRTEYNKQEKIVETATIAVTKDKPAETIITLCDSHFSNLGYNHVDRWKDAHGDLADKFGQEKNFHWCSLRFFYENISLFAQQFRQYISSHGCPLLDSSLFCKSISSYKSCLNIMKSVNREVECTADTYLMGPEAAKKIKDVMIAKGSNQQLYPCNIINPSGPISSQPSQMICTRPVQEYSCNLIKTSLFGNLPQNLVNCYLQESASYKNLRNVVQQARLKLSMKHLGIGIKPDPHDPLIAYVHTPEEIGILQSDPLNQTFSFPPPSTRSNFLYANAFGSGSMDGTDTPKIILELEKHDFQSNPMQTPKDKVIKYADPRDIPDLSQNVQQTLAVNPIAQGVTVNSAFNAPINQNISGVQNQGQQQVMSGSLPPGSQPPGKGNQSKVSFNQNRQIKPEVHSVVDKPDLTMDNNLTIAGIAAQWGGTVQLAGQNLQYAGNGLCRVSVSYRIKNIGTKPAQAFNSTVITSTDNNPAQPQQWNGIPANVSVLRTENILIKTGQNSLKLFIDYPGQIAEQSELNNQQILTVILNGTCQPQQQLQPYQRPSPQIRTPIAPSPAKRLLR